MNRHRALARLTTVVTAASTAVALFAGSAHANVSTFVGNALTRCEVTDERVGVVTGNNTCETFGFALVCTTTVDTPEGSVVTSCTGDLHVFTNLAYVQHRASSQSPATIACTGTGNGTFSYKPTPSSSTIPIPVTVTVHGQTAEFGGVAVLGVNTAVVSGTFSAACGGFGTYAGQVG